MSGAGPEVALVTGAAGSIGSAVARRLGEDGWRVALVDIDGDGLDRVAAELDRERVATWRFDVADASGAGALVDSVEERLGPVRTLVNVAGIVQITPLLDLGEQDWDRMLDVNLKGTFFLLQAVAQHMVASGSGGTIVNTSSISGRSGRADCAHYAASKAAIISVTQSAALALAAHGVRVNAVCPGLVPSDMWQTIDRQRAERTGAAPGATMKAFAERIPLGRAAEAEEIAAAVAFLVGPESSYVTGQALNVCGGLELD
jgi:NAD(P)-dependent dehydrogenase (short-subunit alcohol dehydrogenase family)